MNKKNINEKKMNAFRTGKGIGNVTILPMFVLKIKGKADAKKGETVVAEYTKKLLIKCSACENKEVLKAEQLLFHSRSEAVKIMATLFKDKDDLRGIPAPKPEKNSIDIRSNRRNAGNRALTIHTINTKYETLGHINELIIDVNTCLEQRILKTRAKAKVKISAYLYGVKQQAGFNYNDETSFDDAAVKKYNLKHEDCDEAVKKAVAYIYSGGRENENEMV